MIAAIVDTVRWCGSLGRKFIGVVPWVTLAIVGATLVSQVATLLAFILPVKIVLLLGSDGIPEVLESLSGGLERNLLIILLSLGTVTVYLVHLGAERLVAVFTRVGTNALLTTSRKMALFEGQDEMAANAYTRFSRSVAGAVFVGLAIAAIGLLYRDMAGVIAGYAAVASFIVWALYNTKASFRERLQTNLAGTVNLFAGIGFFIAFGYLVGDFLDGSSPDIIAAVISMVLLRQSVGRVAPVVTGLSGLHRQRTQLEALFFHSRPFIPPQSGIDWSMWPLLQKQRRDQWVHSLLNEMTGCVVEPLRYQWLDLGTPNVAVLGIRDAASGNCRYLVKLFEANRSAAALHEAALLADPPTHLPAPELLGATHIERFHAHVYSWCEGKCPTHQEFHRYAGEAARAAILRAEPPHGLVNRYRRSRAMLWQRLGLSTLEWMQVAVETAEYGGALQRMCERVGELQARLCELPLVFVNPEVTRDALWLPASGEQSPWLLSWVKWALEPVGASWPTQPGLLERLGPAVAEAAEVRPALASVASEHAEVAALAYQLESLAARQRYVYALALVPDILERLDALEAAETAGSVAHG